jgi:hypothetical protein
MAENDGIFVLFVTDGTLIVVGRRRCMPKGVLKNSLLFRKCLMIPALELREFNMLALTMLVLAAGSVLKMMIIIARAPLWGIFYASIGKENQICRSLLPKPTKSGMS